MKHERFKLVVNVICSVFYVNIDGAFRPDLLLDLLPSCLIAYAIEEFTKVMLTFDFNSSISRLVVLLVEYRIASTNLKGIQYS